MLRVAPSGITNCEIVGRTLSFSSAVRIESGMTAAELEVENAKSCTSRTSRKNAHGERRTTTVTSTR